MRSKEWRNPTLIDCNGPQEDAYHDYLGQGSRRPASLRVTRQASRTVPWRLCKAFLFGNIRNSFPPTNSILVVRANSRNTRLARFRRTAFPNRRPTMIPIRGLASGLSTKTKLKCGVCRRWPLRFTRSKSTPFLIKRSEGEWEILFIGNREPVPPFLSSPCEDPSTIFCAHPLTEPMIPFSFQIRRLAKCHRHSCFLLFLFRVATLPTDIITGPSTAEAKGQKKEPPLVQPEIVIMLYAKLDYF